MLNPSIILQGQPVNALRAIDQGNRTAAFEGQRGYDVAQQMFTAQNGPGIMAGEANALRGLSRFNPGQAMQIKSHHEAQARARASAARAAANHRRKQQAEAEKKQAQGMFNKAVMGLQAGDASAWNMMTAELGIGAGALEPTQENLGAVHAFLSQDTEAMLAALDEPDPVKGVVVNGELRNPFTGAVIGEGKTDGAGYRQVSGDEAAALGLDPNRAYNIGPDGKVSAIGAAQSAPLTVFDGEGNVIMSQGVDPKDLKLTVDQGKNAGFLVRMRDSVAILDELEAEGTSVVGRLREAAPFGIGNFFQTDGYQRFEQARRDFVNAVLRRESGAVISDAEFANAERQYFPVPGDSPEVINQKRQNRYNAMLGVEIGAGAGGGVQNKPAPDRGENTQSDIPTPPPGVDPAQWPTLWGHMSEEDKALFH